MTAYPNSQDTQAFDKTRITNETQSFSHTDITPYLNELEQVSWYHQYHITIMRRLIASPNKDEAPNRMSRI